MEPFVALGVTQNATRTVWAVPDHHHCTNGAASVCDRIRLYGKTLAAGYTTPFTGCDSRHCLNHRSFGELSPRPGVCTDYNDRSGEAGPDNYHIATRSIPSGRGQTIFLTIGQHA